MHLRVLAAAATLASGFALSACSGGDEESDEAPTTPTTSATNIYSSAPSTEVVTLSADDWWASLDESGRLEICEAQADEALDTYELRPDAVDAVELETLLADVCTQILVEQELESAGVDVDLD